MPNSSTTLHNPPLAPPAPTSPPPPGTLNPLSLDSVQCIYLAHANQAMQVSLRADSGAQDLGSLKKLYDEVKDDVTDLIALVLHLSALGEPLPSPCQFDGGTRGWTLTCERNPASKTLTRWRWTRDGVDVDPAECKYRFVFARRGIGG
ncbi:hypothetical protein JCM6882_007695 [Rhodosporidiobolus microsporus]